MRSFGIDSNRFTSKSITKSITSRVTRGRITVSKSAAVFGDTSGDTLYREFSAFGCDAVRSVIFV
jgi:hypothetical protein